MSKQHQDDLQELEEKYEDTIKDLEETKMSLNEDVETFQKYCQKLERELTNEKAARQKLEEEYQQNTKNHEEEVQLRLKFESKLNNMHSIHRDVDTKYKRALKEIESIQLDRDNYKEKWKQYQNDYSEIKRIKEETEADLEYKNEK